MGLCLFRFKAIELDIENKNPTTLSYPLFVLDVWILLSLFDKWVKGELADGAWWSGFWLVADDGARPAVAVLDDGGLGFVWEDFNPSH